MSASDRNARKPAVRGLNKDELAAQHAEEDPVEDFSLFGGDLSEAAAEAAAANQLAPGDESWTTVEEEENEEP
jgi:hypothetical protein